MNSQLNIHSDDAPFLEVKEVTMVEAVNLALHRAMAEDDRVVLLGEDVGENGGVFRATEGLKQQFGCKRVMDTPLAETLIAGLSVGMATQGLRPVAEIQFMGFIYAAVEHLVSHAARMRNRTRGRLSCPMVLRAPFGGGIRAPEHHSESTEALFAHIPGLRVVIPSSPRRAYGLLLGAIENPDPVIFLEPKRIYRIQKQIIKDDGETLPLDTFFTLRTGSDITLISWGAMIHETLIAAEKLEQTGVSVEVIDLATISPIDYPALATSVIHTGRCLIVQEAALSCSVACDIATQLNRLCFDALQAPIEIVAGYDIPMPYYQNEHHYMPSVERILRQANIVLEGV